MSETQFEIGDVVTVSRWPSGNFWLVVGRAQECYRLAHIFERGKLNRLLTRRPLYINWEGDRLERCSDLRTILQVTHVYRRFLKREEAKKTKQKR